MVFEAVTAFHLHDVSDARPAAPFRHSAEAKEVGGELGRF